MFFLENAFLLQLLPCYIATLPSEAYAAYMYHILSMHSGLSLVLVMPEIASKGAFNGSPLRVQLCHHWARQYARSKCGQKASLGQALKKFQGFESPWHSLKKSLKDMAPLKTPFAKGQGSIKKALTAPFKHAL